MAEPVLEKIPAEILEKIPAEKRWETTAKSLIGACVGYSLALLRIVGKEKHAEIESKMWGEGGKTSFLQVKEAFKFPVEDAVGAVNLGMVVTILGLGPEFEIETIEKTRNRVVFRVTKCAFWERIKEFGATAQYDCVPACSAWGAEGLKAVNPKITRKIVKAFPDGDPYCEVIYEFKE